MNLRLVLIVTLSVVLGACSGASESRGAIREPLSPIGVGAATVQSRKVPYDANKLVADLRAAGRGVLRASPALSSEPFGVTPIVFCVDGTDRLLVYAYPTIDERTRWSDRIGVDGSIGATSAEGGTIVDWIAAPHFYARGSIVVVAVGVGAAMQHRLAGGLGPTLNPSNAGSDGQLGKC